MLLARATLQATLPASSSIRNRTPSSSRYSSFEPHQRHCYLLSEANVKDPIMKREV
jgi:hypothetical protein